ncbi:MAG: hypothetical protein H7Z19_08330, partial [Chitinophagaceae bacterium]|nr:hypothetical protein [Rubrivivax sp.]
LAAFGQAVSAALEQAIVQAAASAAPRAVVLDLRGNPGGLLFEAVKVADTFLSAGEIVSLRRQEPARSRAWQSDAAELLAGVPMVVLIDGRSASASELVADALQYHGRAIVMGQRSYGKGSVQSTLPIGQDGGAIKLTTSLYHGPSGQTVHGTGVAPDIELLAMPVADTFREGPAAAGAAESTVAARRAKARADPAQCAAPAESDRALACAMDYLRAGGVDAFLAKLAERAP